MSPRLVFGSAANSSNLAARINRGGVRAVMAEHSDLKYVGIVATIIGGVVLVLGIVGVALTLS